MHQTLAWKWDMNCEPFLNKFTNAKKVHVYEPFCLVLKKSVHKSWAHFKTVHNRQISS